MLDIHPASHEERETAYRNVHDVWSAGLPIEEHVRRRLASPKHQRASWFVGCIEGRVATALGSYAVDFCVDGEVVPGMAIGSVHTLAEFRGQGYASELLPWVENHERARGVKLSLLYSDVPAAFYERLGYVTCPSFAGWVEIATAPPESDSFEAATETLVRFDPLAELGEMARLYAYYHGAASISIARSPDYWRHLLERQPDEEFYWLQGGDAPAAYVGLSKRGDVLKIGDFALASQDQGIERRLYGAVIEMGKERAVKRVGGWLPRTGVTSEIFELAPRRDEITMLKSLDGAVRLDADTIATTDRFCEIDHV